MAEVAIIGSDIQEVIGSAIALRVLSQVHSMLAQPTSPMDPPVSLFVYLFPAFQNLIRSVSMPGHLRAALEN